MTLTGPGLLQVCGRSPRQGSWLRLMLGLALALGCATAWALEPVTLQLKWRHAFQFAGYYAAQAQGYYRDAGFDVTIREARPGENVVDEVVSGRAQFGVGTSSLVLERHAGRPVVVLAAIFQHSPYVLIARADRGIRSIHDLSGRRVMMEPLSDELLGYLQREGIRAGDIQRLEHTFDVQDLVQGRTDAIAAYVINQPYDLRRLQVPFMEFSPRSSGVDFYGDNLFTSEAMLQSRPGRVEAFRAASLRGWQHAMAHPEEVARLIRQDYSTEHELGYLLFQADRMRELVQADVVPVGYMHPGRWQHIAETYAALGMMPRGASTQGLLYEPDPGPGPDLGWWWTVTGGSLAALALAGGVLLQITRINRRLKASLQEVGRARDRLQVLSTAIDQSPAAVVITDPEAHIEYTNPQFTQISGYGAQEAVGERPSLVKSGLTDPAVYGDLWQRLRSGQPWHGELLNRRKSGELYWEDVHIAPVKAEDGRIVHFVAIKIDITERKHAQAELAASEAKFRAFVENASDLISARDPGGTYTYASPNWKTLLGHEPADVLGRDAREFVHPEDLPAWEAFIERVAASRSSQGGLEVRVRHLDGSWRWHVASESPLLDDQGRVTALLSISRDVTERRKFEERMRHLAQFDALTDLPNRALVFDRLAQSLTLARRHQRPLALLFIDLDDFKPINDTWGHAEGDAVLVEIGRRLRASVRASDTVGRVGGDEFVVLLQEVDGRAAALAVAAKIRQALAEPITRPGRSHRVDASIGVALYPDHGDDVDTLTNRADTAMYAAKRLGRGGVQLYEIGRAHV